MNCCVQQLIKEHLFFLPLLLVIIPSETVLFHKNVTKIVFFNKTVLSNCYFGFVCLRFFLSI